jgi:hypothetical protein
MVSRRTVIRYAQARLVSEDMRGRVRLHEVAEVLLRVPVGIGRAGVDIRRDPNMPDRVRYSNAMPRAAHRDLLWKHLGL